MELRHAISLDIEAPAADVWRVLMDLSRYPRWNRTITRASGDPSREGSRLDLWLELGAARREFRPVVFSVRPERLLLFEEQLVHPALLRGTHAFRLEPQSDGPSSRKRTRLTQEWQLAGLLASVAWPKFRGGFEAFARMNEDLAAEVEGRHTMPA